MESHFKRDKYREEERIIGPALDAIENAYNVLLAFPEYDSVKFFTVSDHQMTENAEQACQKLMLDIFNWLKFFWWTTAFKARQLASALVYAYNHDNFLAWLILGRSSLEYAAVSHYFAKKINQPGLQGPVFSASHLQSVEGTLMQYAHGSRFNWPDLLAGNRDGLTKKFVPAESSSAVQVMTALDHLSKRDDRCKDVRIAYEMLSDFAHPNMASHTSVMEMPSASGIMHESRIAAQPSPLRGEFIMVTSLPSISIGIGTTVEILLETAPLLNTWLTYIDGIQQVHIDFTK